MVIEIPKPEIPPVPRVDALYLKMPSADIPRFPPIVIPPGDLENPPGVKAESKEKTEQPEQPKLNIPVIDINLPLPTAEVVATATYAAVAAVATTTLATPFFDQIKKKLQKFLQGKIDKWKQKRKEKISSES